MVILLVFLCPQLQVGDNSEPLPIRKHNRAVLTSHLFVGHHSHAPWTSNILSDPGGFTQAYLECFWKEKASEKSPLIVLWTYHSWVDFLKYSAPLFLNVAAKCNLYGSQNCRHAESVNTKEVVSLAITGMWKSKLPLPLMWPFFKAIQLEDNRIEFQAPTVFMNC